MQKIEVKTYRDRKIGDKEKDAQKGTVSFGKYDFSHLVENSFAEKTPSGRPIFKTILFLRNQSQNG